MDYTLLNTDIFDLFDEQWGVLTAGTLEDNNAMTISWGQLGSLWGNPGHAKNVVTVFVKPIRYTFKFMEKYDYFTISWFDKQYRKDLALLGSKSGRDGDKIALTKLTRKAIGESVTYNEANLVMLCRKIYCEQLKKDRIPENIISSYYTNEEPHYMYIGEIIRMESSR